MKNYSAILRVGVAAGVALFAATTAAHAQDKVIKIGGLFAMSGPGSYFGVQDKQGIELAVEQLNKPGVNGYKFEVQYEDSACSPLPATQAVKRLLEQ
jgi:branched-chain amino acid transport system substrate-binding protein